MLAARCAFAMAFASRGRGGSIEARGVSIEPRRDLVRRKRARAVDSADSEDCCRLGVERGDEIESVRARVAKW